jgi:hypothetical protein
MPVMPPVLLGRSLLAYLVLYGVTVCVARADLARACCRASSAWNFFLSVATEAACRKAVCRAAPASRHTSSGFRWARHARLPQPGSRENGGCACNTWRRRARVERNTGRQGHLLQALAPPKLQSFTYTNDSPRHRHGTTGFACLNRALVVG